MGNLRTRRSSFAGISVAAVMAVTLGACGGSSSPTSTPAVKAPPTALSGSKIVLASVQTTAAEKSARESLTVSTKGSGPLAFSMTANGLVDFATGDSQFTADLGGATAAFLPGGFEVRVVDKVVYTKLPDSIGRFFGGADGKQWLSVGAPKGSGVSSPFSGLGQSDPTKILASLERVSDDVKEVGTETVRGVETKHYTATLDLGKAIDNSKVPQSLRDKADQLFGGASTPPMPVDVFLDSEGRLRRMTLEMDLSAFSGTGTGASGSTGALGSLPTVSMTLDLYDFGTPVDVQAPPADQIISLKDFGMNGGGSFGGGSFGGSPAAVPSTKVS